MPMEVTAERMHAALLAAFEGLFASLDGARFQDRGSHVRIRFPAMPHPMFNGVWPVSDGDAAAVLAEAVAEIESDAVPCGVLMRNGFPACEATATGLGFTEREALPGMMAVPADFHPPEPPDLRIMRADPSTREVVLDVTSRGFEVPPRFFAPLLTDRALARMATWLAIAGDEPVTTALGYVAGGGVGIFDVATPPEHRRKGYGTAVTAHAVQAGFADGAAFAFLQSSAIGESVYRALGFTQVETYVLLTRPRGET